MLRAGLTYRVPPVFYQACLSNRRGTMKSSLALPPRVPAGARGNKGDHASFDWAHGALRELERVWKAALRSAHQLYAVDHGVLAKAEARTAASSRWKPSTETEEPISRLFAAAERAQSGCTRSIEFDETYSYPKKIYFDCAEEGSGEEVRCFEADTLDLEACRARTVR